MRRVVSLIAGVVFAAALSLGQATFDVTGTPIPPELLKQNYGSVPKGISAYDLSICNITDAKQSIVSSKIFQALSESNAALQPVGRQIMLAAILRNQNHSAANVLNVALTSITGVLSILGTSKYKLPAGLVMGAALSSLSGQQLISNLKPILSADQLEKFESQVLEPALVLDGGSCVERTVFTTNANAAAKTKAQPLNFHVRN